MSIFVQTIFLLALPSLSFAQVGLAFFSTERQIAISSNFEKRFWGEFRLSTQTDYLLNRDDDNGIPVRPWAVGHANIKSNSQVSISIGLGIGGNGDYYDSSPIILSVPLAIRFAPFEKAKNVYFLGEFSPATDGDDFEPMLNWGVRYLFLKDE